MDEDDPRTPLLGHPPEDSRVRRAATKLCGLESWRRRVPITTWLPTYKLEYLFRDLIAGVTVGLTSIPQGIAYAIIAGLPPQVGLYSSIFPGFVYMMLGSCKDVTVGPTAILAALLAKYVAKSEAFAYLAAFLSGCIIMLLGALQLGFLLDFISKPVISGFTTAAALQIGASQLKSLFRITGSSGSTFIQAVANLFRNIKTIHLWDTVLGVATIVVLLLLKRVAVPTEPASSACRVRCSSSCQYVVRARNALVVFAATLLAYVLYLKNLAPFALTGTITGGLPHFGPPPFSTMVGNQTLGFQDMLAVFGPEGFVMPLIAILESIAIARAFAGSKPVDGTQEMIAVGACNIVSSFCQSMPATGSFTRTALNHASGVVTPAGSMFKGFLLDFISKPVISGFTTAAALQIGASQLKSLFRITGSSGSTFIQAVANLFRNIKTIHLWDTVLGVATIVVLLLLKRVAVPTEPASSACRVRCSSSCQYVVRARNALVVFAATLLAYVLYLKNLAPFALTGTITGGLPHFGPPPFSTMVGNQTLGFQDMLAVFGPEGFVMPLIAILESIAIARAFAGSKPVDGTQEMIAVGACNIVSSFCQSMPATGSFTRTALNHASGVVTPAGSMFKALLVLLSVTLLTDAFYFIPRAVLAAVIMVAMMSIIELGIVRQLWRNSKLELLVYSATVVVGCTCGLEYGIAAGAGGDAVRALATAARPKLHPVIFKVGNQSCISLTLSGPLSYASAEHCARALRRPARGTPLVIVLDGRLLTTLDLGVAESLVTVIVDLETLNHRFLLWNFPAPQRRLLQELKPSFADKFVAGPSIDQHVLGLEVQRITTISY